MTPRRLLVFIMMLSFAAGARAQERQWSLDASDQDAYLIFGVPDSDDIGISIWCPIRQGTVNIYVPEGAANIPAGTETDMSLKAVDEETVVKGKAEINDEAGVSSVESQIPADAPIFEAMIKADRLTVKIAGEQTIFPLFDADVPGLLELCRKN